VLPTPLYQGGQPCWASFRKLWPQTINFYPLAKTIHFLTFKRLFPSQDLIAHKSETVHVCFERYAGGCSPGTTAPLSIENTSGAIHKVIPTFDVCLENLVLEIFVLDVPKSAIFALRYPSLYSSSGTPVRAFTKMFKDLTSHYAFTVQVFQSSRNLKHKIHCCSHRQ